MLQPYDATRKCLKWYRKVAIHLIQIAMLNAHVIYTQEREADMTFLKFQQSVSVLPEHYKYFIVWIWYIFSICIYTLCFRWLAALCWKKAREFLLRKMLSAWQPATFRKLSHQRKRKPDRSDVAVCAMPAQRPAKIPDITAASAPANLDCALKAVLRNITQLWTMGGHNMIRIFHFVVANL